MRSQFIEKIFNLYNKVFQYITIDIWKLNINDIKGARARLVKYLKVVMITAKNAGNDKLGLYTVSLSYFTALAVVPFAAAAFVVTGGFGLERKLEELLLESFVENQETLKWIIQFAENIVKNSQQGLFGIISFLCFLWVVIWMIINVEKSFNRIWKVSRARSFTKRIFYYLGIIVVTPLVLTIFLSVVLFYRNAVQTLGTGFGVKYLGDSIGFVLQWLLFYGVVSITFCMMYKLIPNTKVKFHAAMNAAWITAFAFVVMQYLYMETQVMVSRMNAVYGAFAAIPLFLIWLNISWTIILVGAEISHAFQNLDTGGETSANKY